jgi:phosphomannomutase
MSNEDIRIRYGKLQNGSDIRGVAMEGMAGQEVNLSSQEVESICRGFIKWLSHKTGKAPEGLVIAIGRDSRLTGPELVQAGAFAMSREGATVYDTGLSSTPAMFMSTLFPEIKADGSIMVTASHLPWNRNGLKFFSCDGGLDKGDIRWILDQAALLHPDICSHEATPPDVAWAKMDLMTFYAHHLKALIRKELGQRELPLSGMKILVDAGNGAGGFYATEVLEPLGADITGSCYLEPDGTFPHHPPNPEDEEAMSHVCNQVIIHQSDLGLIFDTDVDRIGAVDSAGREIARNRIVALASVLAAEKSPGTTIVTDSITSTQLHHFLETHLDLTHHRFQRGYRNVINEAIRLNQAGIDSQLAIETSGHAAFKDNYFLDDGAYLATLIVIKAARLKKEGSSIQSLLSGLMDPAEAMEIRFPIQGEDFASLGDQVLQDLSQWIENLQDSQVQLVVPNYEGVRVNLGESYGNGWFLLRKSLHDPILPLNMESNQSGGVQQIREFLKPFLGKYDFLNIKDL